MLSAAFATNNSSDSSDQAKICLQENNMMRRSSRTSIDSNQSELAARRPSLLMTRRRSSFRNLAQSVNFMRRLSGAKAFIREKDESEKNRVRYENTYRMEPGDNHFRCDQVRETVERLLNTYLRDQKYDERRCRQLVTDMSARIKNSVKELDFKRYKIICNVIIGQKKGQGMESAGRCCWDPQTDNYVTVHFENDSMFVVCTVHGVYFE